ncbi:MAG: AraC family transcriptional regulator [Candidatus Saccharibacteria bacterium]|nr:AraC family transcriptional regulator [Moraxellaceae bacterium]
MAEFALEHALVMSDILLGTDLKESELADPAMVVSGHQELRLIRNLMTLLPNVPALGLKVGSRYHATTFGVLGFAIVSSSSMRHALDLALQYFHLTFAFTKFIVTDSESETTILIDDSDVPDDVRQFVVERDAAALFSVQRDFTTDTILLSLNISSEAPSYIELYEAFFGITPNFNMRINSAVMDRQSMQRPLLMSNALALHMAEAQCRQILDSRKTLNELSSKIREKLMCTAGYIPIMTTVAAELHMTARTLRRRLGNEGTTFIQLRDEVRQALAEQYLTLPHQSIDQISERLGYAEPTSFINAYKRWKGQTPHAFRLAKRQTH